MNRYTLTVLFNWRAALTCAAALSFIPVVNAGMEEKAVAPLERPFDWTGFYVGGNIGGVLSDYEFHGDAPDHDIFADVDIAQQFYSVIEINVPGESELGDLRFFGPDAEERRGSVLGGGQIGYNRQFGHFVFGIEGDFDRTSQRASDTFKDSGNTFIIGDGQLREVFGETTFSGTRRAESNWNGSVRGRFGWANGRFLFYGTAGIIWADVRTWADDVARTNFFDEFRDAAGNRPQPPADMPSLPALGGSPHGPAQDEGGLFVGTVTNTNISRDDDVFTGWTAGGGIEWAISDTVSLGLDYRHNDLGGETHHFSSHGGPIYPAPTHIDLDSDQVTVRLNVMLSHLFGHDTYASTTTTTLPDPFRGGDNLAVAYNGRRNAREEISSGAGAGDGLFDWSGFYVGGNVGGVWTDYDFGSFDTHIVGPLVEYRFVTPGIEAGSNDSIFGGGQLGYQKQFGHFVVGVEGDFNGMSSSQWTRFDSTQSLFIDVGKGFFTNVTNLTTLRKATVDWQASARGRLGWSQGRLLLYVTGGGTWAKVRTWATDMVASDYFFEGEFFAGGFSNRNNSQDDGVVCGWTGGGGAEWAFTNAFSMGLEYRHNGFGDAGFDYDSRHSFAIHTGSTNLDLDSDQVTFKVNVLLGRIHGP